MHSRSVSRKKKENVLLNKTLEELQELNLPKVKYEYSFWNDIKTTWKLSNIDFKYIVTSLPFISILLVGLIFILLTALSAGELFGTKTYPTDMANVISARRSFSLFINLMTFLYAGMLVHRGKIAGANHLLM